MARFLTRRYVAVTWTEALRLAALDQTPWSEIRQAEEVQLLHREEWWAWWSDEQLTTAIGLPESLCPETLSTDAAALITEVFESYGGTPDCGWETLARVEQVLSRERQPRTENTGGYDWITLELVTVGFTDGLEGVLRCWYKRSTKGFECQIERVS